MLGLWSHGKRERHILHLGLDDTRDGPACRAKGAVGTLATEAAMCEETSTQSPRVVGGTTDEDTRFRLPQGA